MLWEQLLQANFKFKGHVVLHKAQWKFLKRLDELFAVGHAELINYSSYTIGAVLLTMINYLNNQNSVNIRKYSHEHNFSTSSLFLHSNR